MNLLDQSGDAVSDIVRVQLSELGDLVSREMELAETVNDLKKRLKNDWRLRQPFDEEKERERRRVALQELKDGYAKRIQEAEDYVEAPIPDKRTEALNALAASMVELANVRRQMKASL